MSKRPRRKLGDVYLSTGVIEGQTPRPTIPTTATLFQHGWGWECPITVHRWAWSIDAGQWSALCTFNDGWEGWTYPKTWGVGWDTGTTTQRKRTQRLHNGKCQHS